MQRVRQRDRRSRSLWDRVGWRRGLIRDGLCWERFRGSKCGGLRRRAVEGR